MSGILAASTCATLFSARTVTYTSGSGTETVPYGATSCIIDVWAGGGGGQKASPSDGTGGGAGGYSRKTVAVSGGQTFSYSVGAGGAGKITTNGVGADGNNSTVSSAAPSVSITCNKGLGGTPGTGGTASGGDTNTTGGNGTITAGGTAGGTSGNNAGDGGRGNIGAGNGVDGHSGEIRFAYS